MQRFIKNFVKDYRDFLVIKKTGNKKPVVPIFSVIKESLFLLVLIALFTFLFQLHKNLHFVLLVTQVFLVGSFLLFRVKYEILVKKINQFQYPTYVGVTPDTLRFLMVISALHAFIYVAIMPQSISSVLTFMTIAFSIIVMFIYLYLDNMTDYIGIPQILRILWISLFALGFFYSSGIESLIHSYLATVGVVSLFIFFYHVCFIRWQSLLKMRRILTYLVVISMVVMGFFIYRNKDIKFFNSITYHIPNAKETLTYTLPTDIRELTYSSSTIRKDLALQYKVIDNQLVLEFEDRIDWFNDQFKMTQSIDKEVGASYYFFDGLLYKTVLSDDQTNIVIEPDPMRSKSRYDLFVLNESLSFDFIDSIIYRDRLHELSMIDIYVIEGSVYYLEHYDLIGWFSDYYRLYNKQGGVVTINVFRDQELIYKGDNDFLIKQTHDFEDYHTNSRMTYNYHNDYIYQWVDEFGTFVGYIYQFDHWLHDLEPTVQPELIPGHASYITRFYHHDNRYYVLSDRNFIYDIPASIYVYDEKGKEIDMMDGVDDLLSFDSSLITVGVSRKMVGDENISTYEFDLVGLVDFYQYGFKTQDTLVRIQTALMMFVLVLSTGKLFYFKREG